MHEAYPGVKVVTAWVDEALNQQKYIVPGLGGSSLRSPMELSLISLVSHRLWRSLLYQQVIRIGSGIWDTRSVGGLSDASVRGKMEGEDILWGRAIAHEHHYLLWRYSPTGLRAQQRSIPAPTS